MFFDRLFTQRRPVPRVHRNPGQITCPYCFEPFAPDEVCFLVPAARSSRVHEEAWSASTAEDGFGGFVEYGVGQQQVEKARPTSTANLANEKLEELFQKRTHDPELETFWDGIGTEESYMQNAAFTESITWNSPLVTPKNKGSMTLEGYETDEDGFVDHVRDRLSKKTSRVRVCPYCHNVLPEHYGKYEVVFFSIVGVTSAGKTVYLHQLLGSLERYLQQVGLTLLYKDKAAEEFHPILSENDVLPASTSADTLRPPLSFTVMDQTARRYYTLVFYDISGENCVRAGRMRKFGPYITHADAILMLIDPVQFPQLEAEIRMMNPAAVSQSKTSYATEVLKAMYENFLLQRVDRKKRVSIPIAFTISKSDLLDPLLRQNPYFQDATLLKPEVATGYLERKKRNVVDFSSIIWVNAELRTLLQEKNESGFCELVDRNFSRRQLLAVSALGCGTRDALSNTAPLSGSYVGTLKDETGLSRVVIHLTEGNRCVLEDVEDQGGGLLCYDLREGTLEKCTGEPDWQHTLRRNLYIRVDCTGKTQYYEYYCRPQENKGQDGAELLREDVKVPATRPNPRRVAEPLFWLLAELGLVPRKDKG